MLIASYAKINLFLEVTGKLPNGFHEVNTVFSSIDLFDTLTFTLTKTPSVNVLSNVPDICGDKNLIYKVSTYLQSIHNTDCGVTIYLKKRIPIASGMGGGSSNAAVTIVVLNDLWGIGLSKEEMHNIASTLGSDLNFFLVGGTAIGKNRGDVIASLPDIDVDNILLVNPGIEISAKEAYGAVELPVQCETRHFDQNKVIETMFNRLEHGICMKYPKVSEIIELMKHNGACKSQMSGSGSTCFGIFKNDDSLDLCRSFFTKMGYWTHKTRTLSRSEYVSCFQSLN